MISKIGKLAMGAAMATALMTSAAYAGDVDAGKKVFNKCRACHTTDEGGANKVGPNLHGIIGRDAATVEGFKYSQALQDSGIVWTEDKLTEFLAKPKAVVPKTKMAFPGLKKPEDIENVLAYLAAESE